MFIDNIVVMDSLEFLKSLEDNSVDLIVTSPPLITRDGGVKIVM